MIEDIQNFINTVPKNTSLLGLDLGDKTIGVAISDTLWMTASPIKTIFRKSFEYDISELKKIIGDRTVGAIISGLPLQMNGLVGERAKITTELAKKISTTLNIPLFFQDERLSSRAVEQVLIKDYNFSRKKRKQTIDCGAASFILQGFLDKISLKSF